ncbi:class I SAM-dependent DNA methyltransferase [Pedobacter nototheniae]|uniref:class I SAM-dependent DNA methyltransferase n=1 Tax=Pedobacter nototheniae TaxID=2488994 RepID=UPI00103910F8|nr:class I SAM-dependent DNA methyltransferase [Pedobacter nototheniae]
MTNNNNIVQKVWNFCDTLRDDGVSYGDYLEQITYLLFLKMVDEYSGPNFLKEFNLPEGCDWNSLLIKEEDQLISFYSANLKILSFAGGMLTKIFDGAQNKIHDQNKLKKLIELINAENWVDETFDVKGEIYESLLQKNAESSGAGQYFTPRAVIQTMVECLQPEPLQTIADPSCGTGGFFLGALNYITKHKKKFTEEEKRFLKFDTFHGWEIVPSTARLCLMNLFLHGIGDLKTTPEIEIVDSLKKVPSKQFDIILANPPFGKSSSDIATNDEKKAKQSGYTFRNDFWITTGNKQLAFLQHIFTMLKENGEAAVVLPDNVLFEGGAGETIRKRLLSDTNLHTILRLPTGLFYAQGVKANVLFFTKVPVSAKPSTDAIWIYDYRTNIHHTLKKNPLRNDDLSDFVKKFCPGDIKRRVQEYDAITNPEGRWRKFSYDEIISREKTNLDIQWLSDDENSLELFDDPEDLANNIIENLETGLEYFKLVRDSFSKKQL